MTSCASSQILNVNIRTYVQIARLDDDMTKYRIVKITDGNGKSNYGIEFERRSFLMPWKKVWYDPLYFISLKDAKHYINEFLVNKTVEVVETGCLEERN